MNPIEIEIILTRNFDFHGFSRYGEGRFTVLCQNLFTWTFPPESLKSVKMYFISIGNIFVCIKHTVHTAFFEEHQQNLYLFKINLVLTKLACSRY